MKLYTFIFHLLLLILFTVNATLASSNNDLKISGLMDLSYSYNLNQPRQVTPPTDTLLTQPAGNNKYHIFDPYHDNFNLSLVEIDLEKKISRTVFFVALGFGHTAEILSPRDEVSKNVLQAHITYSPEQWNQLTLRAGKMMTHMGLEVVNPMGNWNYSRSLLFGYALPFWHTGVSAKYDFVPETFNGSLFLYNETLGLYEANRSKTGGAQFQFLNPSYSVTYNFLSGNELDSGGSSHVRVLHELIPTYEISSNLLINGDFIFGQLSNLPGHKQAQWTAGSVGLKWKLKSFSLSPRYEVYTDRSGATIETATPTKPALPQRTESFTLTSSWQWDEALETRCELRRDFSTSSVFEDDKLKTHHSQTLFTVAMLFNF